MSVSRDGKKPPKDGRIYLCLGVVRISGSESQSEKSNDDQAELERQKLRAIIGDNFRLEILPSVAKGEVLDRDELSQLYEKIETGVYDFVICEDLGRIVRRVHAHLVCEACEDNDTRLIAINDNVDTAEPGWRMHSLFAVMRHESYNQDTSKRIRRTIRNRFMNGGHLRVFIFGYIVPPDANSDSDVRKDPAAEPIYEMMFVMLEEGASYSAVADKLNELGIPTGHGCKAKEWSCAMVRRLIHNPILHGVRELNRRMSVRKNKDGRRKSVKAPPEELLIRHVPHLAFVSKERQDALILMLKFKNQHFSRSRNGFDPLAGRARKKTVWPGQHLYCAICGRPFYYGKQKGKFFLNCSGVREYKCWNALQIDAEYARKKIAGAVLKVIEQQPDFDESLRQNLQKEVSETRLERDDQLKKLNAAIAAKERELDNLTDGLKQLGSSESLIRKIEKTEAELQPLLNKIRNLKQLPDEIPELPPIAEIKELAKQQITQLAEESAEYAMLMRKLIPKIYIYPVQICDGRGTYLRAQFQLNLGQLVEGSGEVAEIAQHLSSVVTVDLFEPPQRVAFLEYILQLHEHGLNGVQIAEKLQLTKTAVNLSLSLHQKMKELGLASPFYSLLEPPADSDGYVGNRHKHPRFKFEPWEGFPLPPLQ